MQKWLVCYTINILWYVVIIGVIFFQRERISVPIEEAVDEINDFERRTNAAIATTLQSPPRSERCNESKTVKKDSNIIQNSPRKPDLPRSSTTNTPKYVGPSNRSCKVSILYHSFRRRILNV